jgi:hypothetical protein
MKSTISNAIHRNHLDWGITSLRIPHQITARYPSGYDGFDGYGGYEENNGFDGYKDVEK